MKERNGSVDLLRGIAIAMVVLGHTMTSCTADAPSTVLYNIIWSIQMPLFFLISGYVTRYSSSGSPGKMLWKRTKAYLIPWAVWTVLIRGLIFGQENFLDLKQLLWSMDSGYWFLVSLWMITIIYGFAQYFAEKAKGAGYWGVLIGVYLLGAVFLAAVGLVMGLSFFCIKLTLYYMPFFAAGVFFGKVQDKWIAAKHGKKLINAAVCLCSVFYFPVILRVNLYEISDGFPGILIRAAVSLAGCIILCALCTGIQFRPLQWLGTHSLEIYLVHYLALAVAVVAPLPEAAGLAGLGLTVLNYAITMLTSVLCAYLLNRNDWVRKICFGR